MQAHSTNDEAFDAMSERLAHFLADAEARCAEALRAALEAARLPQRRDLVELSGRLDAIERRLAARARQRQPG